MAELLLGCWSHAATLFESPNWIEPLWAWGCANVESSATNLHEILGQRLPQKVAEKYVLVELAQAQNEQWTLLLPILPAPWSKDFGDACLETLRNHILTLDGQSYPSGQWQITFEALLPILRRAFSSFQPPERRQMGEKVKHLHTTDTGAGSRSGRGSIDLSRINQERANSILPVLAQIMGVKFDGN